ncbi:FAD:protein FMN transferase [Duganella qianjiadongensis]|uniref:FAD:protein FMN transferase n=1 Tax=Duganella qianjiadongensis TaxID=2692176 RepID=A0ABW9VSR9_9BURK|nr:FAD:protein FMN transferase [Duganella qianjiadongensis]MYM42107.1 FAD:protein FMN transferase [Duganella qianjiadongensis]
MKRRTFIASAVGSIAGVAGCVWTHGATLHTGAALAFGTTISISVVHTDAELAARAISDGLRAAQQIDALMNIYRPDSQVFQLNRDGYLNQPDRRLLQVLQQGAQLSQMTDGAFDVTVQPLWLLYSQAASAGRLPDAAAIRRARSLVNWRELEIRPEQIRFQRTGMALTLNGLAQGYAADQALAAVQKYGIRDALLDTGEFIARGQRGMQRPWTLGVRDPRDDGKLATTLRAQGCSVATSGDYECLFTPDYRHHHIFDPALGDSPPELASVTVLAPNALLADGLSTAFMVMGWERAQALAARMPAVDLLVIDKQGHSRCSAGFPAEV